MISPVVFVLALCTALNALQSANPICDLPAERGGCLGVQLSVYFDSNEGKCKPFIYSGCGGNKNNFINNAACMEACGGGGGGRR
ncbi:hypothetical protein SprV_0501880500 [Sparganum proliferum]